MTKLKTFFYITLPQLLSLLLLHVLKRFSVFASSTGHAELAQAQAALPSLAV